MTDRQRWYRETYLKSPHWLRTAPAKRKLEMYCCEECAREAYDVHHKNYDNLGREDLKRDLKLLCRECHERLHRHERGDYRSDMQVTEDKLMEWFGKRA